MRFLIPAVVVALSACGAPIKKDDDNSVRTPFQDEGYAEDYFVEDKGCQDLSGAEAIEDKVSFYSFQNGVIEKLPFSLEATTSVPSLRNPTIKNTLYGFHQVRDCRDFPDEASCTKSAQVVAAAKNLKICAGKAFSRDSVEGVSITGLAHLTHAREFYLEVEGADRTIAASNLLVLPKVETVLMENGKAVRRVDTDNLAYAPSYAGAPTFVIFPKGKTAKELGYWAGLSLWEIPWGLAHEYGHHIFRTHTGVSTLATTSVLAGGLVVETPLHQSSFSESEKSGFALAGEGRGIKAIWSSVNEGFSDLFAHYSLGGNSDVATLDCFSKNRDPLESTFADQTPKSLTNDILSEFNGYKDPDGDGCTSPKFTDVHAVGAIIAYGVDQYLEALQISDKAGALLAWAEELRTTAPLLTNSSDFADLLSPLVAATKKKTGSQLNRKACLTLEQVFPAYSEIMFRTEASECL